ncbi:hypothetical protein RUM44_013247 [Polyplax serrata]|uniref:Uncharacterized protein n=1 Tax=Polyplax serrata TaxID=468196 RepID=A0ABR1BDL7_POLSC
MRRHNLIHGSNSQNEHPEPDADMLGGIQLLKLELELQNTWRHIDWGPGNKCFEMMECDSHCQDDWFSKSPSICRSYEGE